MAWDKHIRVIGQKSFRKGNLTEMARVVPELLECTIDVSFHKIECLKIYKYFKHCVSAVLLCD